jgi:uncharacterized integral membrane protein
VKLVYWLAIALLAAVFALFAWFNLAEVTISFWPFVELPGQRLGVVVLIALALGFLVGEFVAWINGGRWRREARRRARRIEALERELDATQAKLPKREATRVPAAVGPRD